MEQPKYDIDIFWSEEDGGYIANVPDLKHCSAFGETYEEALRAVQVAIDLHLDVLKQMGRAIPEPKATPQGELGARPQVQAPQPPGRLSEVNEAAQKFTEAVVESYWTVADRGVQAQEQGARLTEEFFNRVIDNLRTQAESNREMTQQLADQQERQWDAMQALTQESINSYMEFVNSMFSFWQGGIQAAERSTQKAER